MLRKAGGFPGLPDSGTQRSAGLPPFHLRSPGRPGFTLIELLIVIIVITILAAIAIPSLLEARRQANETSAIGTMKALNGVELTYRTRYGQYTDLATLASATTMDPSLASGAKSGYLFSVQVVNTSQYYATASPENVSSGARYFYSDESSTIFQSSSVTTPPTADTSGVPPAGFTPIGN